MKPLTPEWIEQAEENWITLHILVNDPAKRNDNNICFYAYRTIEMYLKAVLQEASVRFNKAFDLVVLLDLALPVMPSLIRFRADLEELTDYDHKFRYPGHAATRENADEARALCRTVRETIRNSLGLGE